MAFLDQDLVMYDETVVTTTSSDILNLSKIDIYSGNGNDGADYFIVEVTADVTGDLTVTLADSATVGGTYVAALTHTFATDVVKGTKICLPLPRKLKQFVKSTCATATAGSVTSWIGQKNYDNV